MVYNFAELIIFFFITFLITSFIIFLGDTFVEPQYDVEKNSAYECGFQPFDFDLQQFDVKYYLVALLFLIFDVEVAFFLPFINVSHFLNAYMFLNFMVFLLLFFAGLIYEWKNNYLDWE